MSAYKLLSNGWVQRLEDGARIPPSDDNLDWVRYQEWLAAGNTPDPVDPEPAPAPKPVDRTEQLITKLKEKGVISDQDIPKPAAAAVADTPEP